MLIISKRAKREQIASRVKDAFQRIPRIIHGHSWRKLKDRIKLSSDFRSWSEPEMPTLFQSRHWFKSILKLLKEQKQRPKHQQVQQYNLVWDGTSFSKANLLPSNANESILIHDAAVNDRRSCDHISHETALFLCLINCRRANFALWSIQYQNARSWAFKNSRNPNKSSTIVIYMLNYFIVKEFLLKIYFKEFLKKVEDVRL